MVAHAIESEGEAMMECKTKRNVAWRGCFRRGLPSDSLASPSGGKWVVHDISRHPSLYSLTSPTEVTRRTELALALESLRKGLLRVSASCSVEVEESST